MTEVVPLLMRIVRAEINRIRPAGITYPQLRTMAYLRNHAGISLTELADHLGFLPSSGSKVIDQLATRGLLTRQVDPDDRRRAILTLTPTGEAILSETRCTIETYLAEYLARLSPVELSTISEAMLNLQHLFAPGV